jgi:hypothetical protein
VQLLVHCLLVLNVLRMLCLVDGRWFHAAIIPE